MAERKSPSRKGTTYIKPGSKTAKKVEKDTVRFADKNHAAWGKKRFKIGRDAAEILAVDDARELAKQTQGKGRKK